MSIEYRTLVVGPIATNCYLIWDSATRKAAIIDPGGDRDYIIDEVKSLDLDVEWVLLTHGHFDHAFSAGDLTDYYSAQCGMAESDAPHLTNGLGLAEQFYDFSEFKPVLAPVFLNDGDVIRLGESEVMVMATPGHSLGGLSFATDAGVFCGDTIFANTVGRTDFPDASHSQLISTIRSRILTQDDSVKLFPGHGPATTVGAERLNNPFL